MQRMMPIRVLLLLFLAFGTNVFAQEAVTSLFEFSDEAEAARWKVVNDGVMGGRSSGNGRLVNNQMKFSGRLSLENNGGFASIRTRPAGSIGLAANSTIAMRVKGDGRQYTFNLYTPGRRVAFSYQTDFNTVAGQWVEVRLPVQNFVAHSFGRRLDGVPLDTTKVNAVGVLLGDKREGAFEIVIDWIRVE